MNARTHTPTRRRAAATVEMAVIVPLLGLLVMGMVEVTRAVRDADGWVTMDEHAVRSYAATWTEAFGPVEELPPLAEPLRVRRAPTIFVALKGD